MTYFPTPDPEKLRQLMNSQGYYHNLQTPPNSTGPPRQDDISTASTPQSTLQQTSPPATWPEQYQYGLGLLQMPPNDGMTNGMLRNDVSSLPPVSVPYDWSEDLTTPQPSYFAFDGLPRQYTSYPQNNTAVLAPATTLWNPPQEVAGPLLPLQDASPSMSNYSLSSQLSEISSPYAHSEGCIRTSGSPVMKVEHPWESTTSLEPAQPAAVSAYCPVQPAPEKVTPRPLAPQRFHSLLLPRQNVNEDIESEEEDVKPVLRRPAYRKAYSTEDVRSESQHHRAKREYTTADNANCSCDMCGKLFQRNYNLKAHLETHDPGRPQPHHCHYPHCGKRFVRRTDLLRHEQSTYRRWLPETTRGQTADEQSETYFHHFESKTTFIIHVSRYQASASTTPTRHSTILMIQSVDAFSDKSAFLTKDSARLAYLLCGGVHVGETDNSRAGWLRFWW
ncbi:hypothetical protein LTR78_002306 [Recurvomyces mirabilis]|uniref:C2H2 type master regulator of conidiophore development brlA n=1 Tax=Recurvomyces mirabilis TaxID=574656 RepID=A0AAE0WUU0_9PEZI|nr:hypothetical protein LTR78_002306 [Recurvomyces mirabilis]KAK5160761.1 hypothetical protein LTS14_001774 [Recurvomyces mirabilis]